MTREAGREGPGGGVLPLIYLECSANLRPGPMR